MRGRVERAALAAAALVTWLAWVALSVGYWITSRWSMRRRFRTN